MTARRSAAGRAIPTISAAADLDGRALKDHIRSAVERGAADFLAGRRWFGDKARRIDRVEMFDVAVVPAGPDYFAPTLVRVAFEDRGSAAYFLPIVVTLEALPAEAMLGVVEHGDDRWGLVEALSVPRFQAWLLDHLAAPATVPMQAGALIFEPTSVLSRYLAAAQTGGSRVITGEQSNTSIIFGDAAILKAFRKLQPGVNPDIEIGAYLIEQTTFRHVPPMLGSMRYEPDGSEPVSIGILQTFVPSTGDAWTMTIHELSELISGEGAVLEPALALRNAIQMASVLGRRTGELHVALASGSGGASFEPEVVTPADIKTWQAALVAASGRRRDDLAGLEGESSDHALIEATRRQLSADVVEEVSSGFDALAQTVKIRVHGDYHLGQVLRTVGGDVMILDFEGEPSRPIGERRLKTSALKDVAGMLRSFAYAKVAVLQALPAGNHREETDLLGRWEGATRSAFLQHYLAAVRDAPLPLVPTGDGAFRRALRAWEVDKALYEIAYELNNRPDWLGQVLRTLAGPDADASRTG